MVEIALIFLAGMAGSMHCLGMCGGFACALGADPSGAGATLRRHLLYNLGRVTTYCFFGALAGHLGVLLVGHGDEASGVGLAQRSLALVSGVFMVIVGLQFLGQLGRLSLPPLEALAQRLVGALRTLLGASGNAAPLALGVVNGLLPCPLVYAFAAQAAASGGALPGLSTMAAFGLGTFPMMLLAGGVGLRLWSARTGALPVATAGHTVHFHAMPGPGAAIGLDRRALGVRLAGAFLLILGLVTCARGLLPMAAHLHGP